MTERASRGLAEFATPPTARPGNIAGGDGSRTHLDVESYSATSERGAWASSTVELIAIPLSRFADDAEPTEAYAAAIGTGFTTASAWIDKNRSGLRAVARGLALVLLIEACIDQDQLDLRLPHQLMLACGHAALSIDISTND